MKKVKRSSQSQSYDFGIACHFEIVSQKNSPCIKIKDRKFYDEIEKN